MNIDIRTSPQSHVLHTKPSGKPQLYDGVCSCEKWKVKKMLKDSIRRLHDEHVQAVMGPDRGEAGEVA